MNKRFQWILTLISLFTLFELTHCSNVPISIATSVTLPSATKVDTATETPTSTPKPTLTSYPTPTVTLTSIEEKDNISNLLLTNDNCDLPCWWGITPGKTTKTKAREISEMDNLRLTEYPTGFARSIWVDFQGEAMQGQIEYGTKQDYIDYVNIYSFSLPTTISNSSNFKKTWNRFAPENLIPSLGVPTRIRIDPFLGPSEGTNITYVEYSLYIVYDQKGIRLEYTVRDDLNNKYKVCPTFGSGGNTEDFIGILLASPNDSVPIETYDESTIQENRAIPIEKAAGITPEQFYNLFTQTEKPVCFNVFSNILPIP